MEEDAKHSTNSIESHPFSAVLNNFTSKASYELISVIKEHQRRFVRATTRSKGLPEHIVVNKSESISYKCTVCYKTFKSKSNCTYHKHCADGAEKPYSCSICDRKFSSKTHYSYHNLTHLGSNPFTCNYCEKSFKTKNKLSRHEQVHTDKVKRVSCDICGRLFLRKSSIKIHKRYHTGEKPYQCNECPKAFREKKNLIFHLSQHTGIKNWICEICGKSYSVKWNLELHKRTHTRIRLFHCPINTCEQSFSQNRYLKRHLETHENTVKYLCSICDKEFSRKDNLQRHILNTHLESQYLPSSEVDKKSRKIQTTAAYIQTIRVTSNDKSHIENISPVVRTESVIKSVTKTGDVVDFRIESRKVDCHRVSVIQTIRKHDFSCNKITEFANYKKAVHVDDFGSENPLEIREDDVSQATSYHYLTNVSGRCYQFEDVSPTSFVVDVKSPSSCASSTTDQGLKIRCLLPKKVIAASYNKCSYSLFCDPDDDQSISNDRQSQDGYKLLDLSMKSQD